MNIPDSVITDILKKKNIEKLPRIRKKNKRQAEVMRRMICSFWSSLDPEEREIFLKKRGKRISEGQKNTPAEVVAARARKCGAANAATFTNPETREKRMETGRRVCAEWRARKKRKSTRIRHVDKVRINDYAGIITMSQMKELLNNGKNS